MAARTRNPSRPGSLVRGESRSPAAGRTRLDSKPTASTGQPVLKTLDRLLSKAGVGSRTEARKWIAQGRVAVDGKIIQTPDHWVNPARQKVTFDGAPLRDAARRYILLYKPKGFITTYKDPDGRPTVYGLLQGIEEKVFSAGRLDLDTSGLLILTNDNDFAEAITNPGSHVPKTYLVKASVVLREDQLEQLRAGVTLSDGPTRPALVKRVRDSQKYSFIEMTISEGRNRQVRRMIEAVEAKVLKLVRTAIGGIEIDGLQVGTHRELTSAEIRGLWPAAARPDRQR